MKIHFTKMSGAGNDFVVIDNRSNVVRDASALARKLCDRRWGVGADGLLLLESAPDIAYRMMYYNADGSYGGMCGNGGRCISRYAVEAGIASAKHEFEALGYRYRSVVDLDSVQLRMKNPTGIKVNLVLRVAGLRLRVHYIDTGSPHVVVPTTQLRSRYKTLKDIPVDSLGKVIRLHKQFQPDGTNVNFVEKTGRNLLRMRTYERGVESETLACGTGSIASAIIGARVWKLSSPVTILPASGVSLVVGFKKTGSEFSDITLQGPAVITFRGEVDV